MKRYSAFLLAAAAMFIAIGIIAGASKGADGDEAGKTKTSIKEVQQPSVIDGSVNPELVSDQVAYTLLLRLLANRHTPEDQGRALSYLKMMFGCNECGEQAVEHRAACESRVKAFLAVVKTFEQRVGRLDQEAKEIHDRYGPDLSDDKVTARLNALQRRKEAAVADIVASLPGTFGEEGMEKIHQHVNERVKGKVKIKPTHSHRNGQ